VRVFTTNLTSRCSRRAARINALGFIIIFFSPLAAEWCVIRMKEKMEYQDLRLEEVELCGYWLIEGSKVVADEMCKRIDWLLVNRLEKICTDPSGWELLLRDPTDGRYGERTYPGSEMHGGGPPMLKVISLAHAQRKYGI
jgi:hypothetical protein